MLNSAYACGTYVTESLQAEIIMISIAYMLFVPTWPKAYKSK